MTANRAFKKRVRARAAQTGESYTAALRHIRSHRGATVPTTEPTDPIETPTLRLAVAQTTPLEDPRDSAGMRARGAEIRALMQRAHDGGARLVHLPEAALCFPSKTLLSSRPGEIAESDWTQFDFRTHDAEIAGIRAHARALGLWTVIGAPTRTSDASPAARPRLSMLVVDATGAVAARYDERLLSRTKQTYMYEAGSQGVTFTIDGLTFGCVSGLEGLFGDLFSDYEAEGVNGVLYSTAGPSDPGAEESLSSSAAVAARQNGVWVSYAVHADKAPDAPAGIAAPDGRWAARCVSSAEPALAFADVGRRTEGGPREWRRAMLEAHRSGTNR
ncbi:carbon-nitrogen hydrolase family protein [Pseudactinotalea suaedae]|uniref:carbon-nitrogen hydrolase family protein n=1 Tax=Pseudactinotalea suaedae TaxID=1524924 RepID=UPI0012E157E5|nr:carbon-nitrogen hydrolase family protein [Pseudactinotalea suaedae]